jgi:holliday junction DNA helicase RuvA
MISHVRGIIAETDGDRVVVDVAGVGFELLVPATVAAAASSHAGEERSYFVHLHVRDDALQLFGFDSRRQRAFFRQLTTVSGVGPKVGLAILSAYSVDDLELAVIHEDAKRFESIPGIGRKLAQRLIVELKDRVIPPTAQAGTTAAGSPAADIVAARSALLNWGMTLQEADAALTGAPPDSSVEDLVRYALSRGKE